MSESEPSERRYVDADGVAWRVRETSHGHHQRALYFESAMAFRRVMDYPPDWRNLPTAELEILSHGT
jgi:hypothetical protein